MSDPFDYQRPEWIDRFLQEHPEQRPAIEAAERRMRGERQLLALAVREIYGHVERGTPSRFGLIVTLNTVVAVLRENRRQRPLGSC